MPTKRSFIDGRKRALVDAFNDRWVLNDRTGCHVWIGASFSRRGGYGCFTHRPSNIVMKRAHRVAWSLFCYPINEEQHVLHSCDNPSCVNVGHLFIGNQELNMTDMALKGRQAQKERHGIFRHGRYIGQKKNFAYPSEPV